MTDKEVLAEVKRIKSTFKAQETRARRAFKNAKEAIFKRFGSSDVEQAARHNALRRAEEEESVAISNTHIRMIDQLERLRNRAGNWADLVPTVEPARRCR